jgi:hypothetical protein
MDIRATQAGAGNSPGNRLYLAIPDPTWSPPQVETNQASEAPALHEGGTLVRNDAFTPLFAFESSFWSYLRSALCRLSIRVPLSGEVVHHHPLGILVRLIVRLSLLLASPLDSLTLPHMGEPVSKRLEWGGAAGGSGCQRLGG